MTGEKVPIIKYQQKVAESFSKNVKADILAGDQVISQEILNSSYYPDDKTLSFFSSFVYIIGFEKEKLGKKEDRESAIMNSWEKAISEIIEFHKKKENRIIAKYDKKNDGDKIRKHEENVEVASKEIKKWVNELRESWHIFAWVCNEDDDYFGAAFWNTNKRQVVISHRGTVFEVRYRKTWSADIQGIARLQDTQQIHSACTFSALVIQKLKEMLNGKSLSISFTGHSLGAWLAQITAFVSEYLELREIQVKPGRRDNTLLGKIVKTSKEWIFKPFFLGISKTEKKKKHYKFQKSISTKKTKDPNVFTEEVNISNDSWTHIHTVVFDSPGCYEKLCEISEYSVYRRYEIAAHYLIAALDITIYVNTPNLVNSVNSHKAISRIFQIYEVDDDDETKTFLDTIPKRLFPHFFYFDTHYISNFVHMLVVQPKKTKILSVSDWPSFSLPKGKKSEISVSEALDNESTNNNFLEEKPTKVHFFQNPGQLITVCFDAFETLIRESDVNELIQFFKNYETHNLKLGKEAGQVVINYDAKIVDTKSRCASILTKNERKFLVDWNKSRKEFSKLKNFKSFLQEKNIQFLLKNDDQQEDYNMFLPDFDFREQLYEKIVCCSKEEDVSKVINRTKQFLHLFPDGSEKLELDAGELNIATEELLKDRSDNYVSKNLPQWSFINFEGSPELKTFLNLNKETQSKEKLLILITDRPTKEQVFILRNIIERSQHKGCYLTFTDINDLNEKRDMVKAFKDKNCSVNNILVIDCENTPDERPLTVLNELILVTKNDPGFSKKLIIVKMKGMNTLEGTEEETLVATFQFTDLTKITQNYLLGKDILWRCDGRINLKMLFNKTDSEDTLKTDEHIKYLSENLFKNDELLSLIETSNEIQVSYEFMHNDDLKVLTYEVNDKITTQKFLDLREQSENFKNSVLFLVSKDQTEVAFSNAANEGQMEVILNDSIPNDQTEINVLDKLVNVTEIKNENSLETFYKKCRENSEKKIYWLHFSPDEVELKQVYDKDFYIKRYLHHEIIIKKDKLRELITNNPSNTFIFCDDQQRRFNDDFGNKGSGLSLGFTNLKVVENDMEAALKLFKNTTGRPVHLILVQGEKLIWIRSKGSMENIYDYVYIGNSTLREDKCLVDVRDGPFQYHDTKTLVIADESGMGKSTMLLKLAKEISSDWVIRVNLINFRKSTAQIPTEPNIDFDSIIKFLSLSAGSLSTPIGKAVLKYILSHKTFASVVLLFDGFDEITDENIRNQLVLLFKYLKQHTSSSVRIYITTKLWARKDLEEKLSVFAIRMKEIEEVDQRNFIKKFWMTRLRLENTIDDDFEKRLDGMIKDLFKRKDLFIPISSHVQTRLRNDLKRKIEVISQEELKLFLQMQVFQVIENMHMYFEENKVLNFKLMDLVSFVCSLNKSENLFCQNYLKYYYSVESSTEESKIRSVQEVLLNALHKMNEDAENSFYRDVLGIPLQLRMFATILPHFDMSQSSIQFPNTLSDLYRKFVTLKFTIYVKEKLKKKSVRRDEIKPFLDKHKCLAFQLLFPDYVNDHLRPEEIVDLKNDSWNENIIDPHEETFRKDNWKEMVIDINRIGIIEVSSSGEYRFIHDSVAEFLATSKILELLKNSRLKTSLLKDILLENKFKMMRQFLNDQLELEMDTKAIVNFFNFNVCKPARDEKINFINKRNETCLHIFVSENLVTLATLLLNSFKELGDALQYFLDIKNDGHETALHYAAFNNQLRLAELLINSKPKENILHFTAAQWSPFIDLLPEKDMEFDDVVVSFGKCSISTFFRLREHNKVISSAAYVSNCLEAHQILELIKRFGDVQSLSVSSLQTLSLFSKHINSFEFMHEIFLKHEAKLKIYKLGGVNVTDPKISSKVLYLAASKGDFDIVYRVLNERVATDNLEGTLNETPLLAAARNGHWKIVNELIMRNANVNIVDTNCASVLLYAAGNNQFSIVQELLRKKANMNFVDKIGKCTAIGIAASKKYWDIVEILIKHGADVNIKLGDYGTTVLHYAASAGEVQVVLKLLEKNADINAIETSNNYTPLTVAAMENKWDVVRALIKRGADVDIPAGGSKVTLLQLALLHEEADIAFEVMQKTKEIDGYNESTVNAPIIIAGGKKHWRIVSKLIDLGANIHKRHRKNNYTLLHIAAMDGQLGMVKRLLRMGADKDLTDSVDKATPMFLAAHYNHWDTVLELIDNDADTNIPDKSDHSVLHLAAKKNSLLIVKKLLEKGADKDAISIHHMTPICLAAVHCNWEIVLELLIAGANPNIEIAVDNQTVLFMAAIQGQLNVVEKLLEKNVEKDAIATEDKLTALFAAALCLQWDIVLKLINAGADVNIPNKNNETVLHAAVSNGQLGIVKELIKAKAMIDLYNKETKATPLGIAASHEYWDIVKELVVAGADITIKLGSCNLTVLHFTASAGKTDLVELLLSKGAEINAVEADNGYTPLIIAAKNQHWDTVKFLIDRGADLNIATRSDKNECQMFTALHFTACYNGLDAVRALLSSDRIAIGECENNFSVTAATLAAMRNYWSIVSELIEGGANVSKPAKNSKMTVLHLAAEGNKLNIVQQLLRRRNEININAREASQNMTALFIAAVKDHWEIVKYLVDNDADPNIPDLGFRTVLYLAAEKGNFEIVELLLEKHGIIIDSVESVKKATPIYIAALKGHWRIVQKLIEKGANLNIYYGRNQISVLHLASSSGDLDTVKALLQKGVDVNLTEKNDDVTPIYAAALNNHWNVVLELINAEARVNIPTKKDQKTVYALAVEQSREDILDEVEKRHLDIFYT